MQFYPLRFLRKKNHFTLWIFCPPQGLTSLWKATSDLHIKAITSPASLCLLSSQVPPHIHGPIEVRPQSSPQCVCQVREDHGTKTLAQISWQKGLEYGATPWKQLGSSSRLNVEFLWDPIIPHLETLKSEAGSKPISQYSEQHYSNHQKEDTIPMSTDRQMDEATQAKCYSAVKGRGSWNTLQYDQTLKTLCWSEKKPETKAHTVRSVSMTCPRTQIQRWKGQTEYRY